MEEREEEREENRGDERGAKGSNGRVATGGGVKRRYENGVKEKKAWLPNKL